MKYFHALLALLALLPAWCGTAAAGGDAGMPKNRIVLQVADDDAKKWNAVLTNVQNIQDELGKDNVAIEVVAHGGGIGLLQADSLVANRVEDAIETGVRFVACRNTMTTRKLGDDDMVKGIGYAKAGLVHLMQRQQQGWVYLRP